MVKSDLVTYGGGTERYLFFSVANTNSLFHHSQRTFATKLLQSNFLIAIYKTQINITEFIRQLEHV